MGCSQTAIKVAQLYGFGLQASLTAQMCVIPRCVTRWAERGRWKRRAEYRRLAASSLSPQSKLCKRTQGHSWASHASSMSGEAHHHGLECKVRLRRSFDRGAAHRRPACCCHMFRAYSRINADLQLQPLQEPWAGRIVSGQKAVEVRRYRLPPHLLGKKGLCRRPGVDAML